MDDLTMACCYHVTKYQSVQGRTPPGHSWPMVEATEAAASVLSGGIMYSGL